MSDPELPRLHLVTDDDVLRRGDFREMALELLRSGGPRVALHLRGPASGGGALYGLAAALVPAAREAGAHLLVNDRVDVASTAGAHGVHLGQRSLPLRLARGLLPAGALVGVSTHDEEEERQAAGADYIFVGPVFPTPSHPGVAGRGVAALTGPTGCGARALAIGGVTPDRVAEVRRAGGYGVAVVRGVWDAPHPLDAAMRYLDALHATTGDL